MGEGGLLTVGEVIKRTGLSRKALRLYEATDLAVPVTRTAAGYRLYDAAVLPRLDLIRRARALDVGIGELGELLDLAGGCSERAHEDLLALVRQKLRDTERRIAELRALKQMLRNVEQRLGRDAAATLIPVHRCGSPLCACPVNPPTGKGGEDMTHVELEEQNVESSATSCDCGCECCAPQSNAEKDNRPAEKASAGCGCGCGS